jgi:hypothetical protein
MLTLKFYNLFYFIKYYIESLQLLKNESFFNQLIYNFKKSQL